MPRLSDLELETIARAGDHASVNRIVEGQAQDGEPIRPALVEEIRRLRDLLARAHPHLDAMAAPQDLQDELAAEVREIAADRLARAHRDRGQR
jgi:hypothetical protein